MAGLTPDAKFSKLGGIGIYGRIEALSYQGGTTIGTDMIPVMAVSCLMQHIVWSTRGVWLQVIPTFAAFPGIPNHWQRL